MVHLWKWLLALAVVAGVGAAAYVRIAAWVRGPSAAEKFRVQEVSQGDIISVVTSTGAIQPVQSVQVGSFVSGPIQTVYVDFNSQVKAGDVLARIDPRMFKAKVAGDEAALAHRKADVLRVAALLDQAKKAETRAIKLREQKQTYVTEAEFEQLVAERKSLEAQLKLADAGVQEAEAMLASSQTNLEFTAITSPVDGLIIDRKVDTGQTVASQFQTPVLFVVAPDLESKIHIYASVDEADIGLIRDAQQAGRKVRFTVDAYPDNTFTGKIAQVRLNPTTVQNVVTYTVVVESPNAELKLLPGMTANLTFEIGEHHGVLRIPNGALRFYPTIDQVRAQDKELLEGSLVSESPGASRDNVRHVWMIVGEELAAVEVTIGASDSQFTEVRAGQLKPGQALVVGLRATGARSAFSK